MAQNNLAVLETYLKDILFSEEDILKNIETRDHIFEIKDSENSLGFLSLYDLKAYVFEHEEEAQSYFVRNIDSDEWKNIFEHPYFQRRKPQLVPSDSLLKDDDLEFFILKKGQKMGPYEKHELMEMMNDKEILLTDTVSFNAGHTWLKLYQVDGFDRRVLKESDQLPGMPSEDILQRPSENIKNIGETTDAMTSLAFLGNLKRGKSFERDRDQMYQDEMKKNATTSSIYKWLLVASIVGIIYFLFSIKSQLTSPFINSNENSIGEQAEMLAPVESNESIPTKPTNFGINDQRRNTAGKFETRQMNPVRPANRKSFMETNKFQNSTNSNNIENSVDESSYYYDNAAPMELDPVRAQISKENYDNSAPAPEASPAPEGEILFNQEISN